MSDIDILLGEVRVLRAEIREDINKLYNKIEDVHIQTTKTNGRVTRLEEQQNKCPGKIAVDLLNKESAKDTKEYKIGSLLITVGASVTIVLTIIGLIKMFKI